MAVAIVNSTLYASSGLFYDWTDAVNDSLYQFEKNTIALYQLGCLADDDWDGDGDGGWDCFSACQNATKLWNSTYSGYTLHNCMVYPIVAQMWNDGNLTAEGIDIAKYYGIRNDTDTPMYTGSPGIQDCFNDYCVRFESEDEWCKSPNGTYDIGENWWQLDFPTNMCDGLDAQINGDVMGIGVAISLLMQVAILTLSWLLFHCTRDWIKYLTWPCFRRKDSITPERLQAALKNSKPSKALVEWEGLAEFQDTQVWLMIAVQIACLVALKRPEAFEAESWQQYRNNVGVIYDLAFGGCLPVLLTLVLLRQANQSDWLVLLTTACSVSLAAAAWMITWQSSFRGFEPAAIEHKGPATCGQLKPTALCFPNDWFAKSSVVGSYKGLAVLIFCWVLLLYLIIENFRVFKQRPGRENRTWKRNILEVHKSWIAHTSRARSFGLESQSSIVRRTSQLAYSNQFWHALSKFILLAAEVALLALTLRMLKDYSNVFDNENFVVLDKKSWSLGQVIAVTAFVPPVVRFIWYCIFGKKEEDGREDRSPEYNRASRSDSDPKMNNSPEITEFPEHPGGDISYRA
ncbi:hypothetical protein M409DRAFT_55914 [Zasmidium cellare ATCC 36951]|uniref:Uncharacterized protein n=1 Tax=Zasmidium cellare ATCC 36951 TaxID=1080233 RepID=A0A6A6CEQ3_ZASCE|nr:uncharacterized protein M409DRAFT_55914 [Zasmidium cellare ATCC 36951]KAF2165541.1 hypothetical protein M409DRAFT_55914 [Zasmidium cellare ATCC 36951]